MCGIVGVTGAQPTLPVLLDGLSRLEYRGYDSAGVALQADGSLWTRRRRGKLAVLAGSVADAPAATAGIGHTRWATHGPPSEANAHPHADCTGRLAIVHNGIVENHRDLRTKLEAGDHRFASETDSELLAHLVEEHLASGHELAEAVSAALRVVEGSVALAVVSAGHPRLLVAARRGSPLIVGTTATAGFVASDVPALLPHTKEVYVVGDGQVVEVRPGDLRVSSPEGGVLQRERRGLDGKGGAPDRGGFPDFMLKEIHEQPDAIAATLGGRRRDETAPSAERIGLSDQQLRAVTRVLIAGCGTSLHAGLVVRPAFESWARVPVECEAASELRYREPILDRSTLVVAISQSGETVDTLYAMRQARAQGAIGLTVTNVEGSALAREADTVLYTRAGMEVGVAATKTHVAQVVALQQLAIDMAGARGSLPLAQLASLTRALRDVPSRVREVLDRAEEVTAVAARFAQRRDFFFLGRGPGHALALEGALKLKEVAYVRAEAYAAGEMKHGPIALIEPGVVVIAVVGSGVLRAKMLSNVAEVKARGATTILLAADGDQEARELADAVLSVPDPVPGAELLSSAVEAVPLQLLAYAIAKARGRDVDKPRNLAKTVTVE